MVVISNEFFRLLSPVFYLSRIFCLLPLKWTKKETNYVIEKSRGYIIYSNLMVTFVVVSSIYGFSQLYRLPSVYEIRLGDNTKRYVTFSDVGVVLFPSIFGVVITSIKINKYIDFIDNLNKADSYLQRHPQRVTKQIIVTVVTMFFITSLLIYDMVMWIRISSNDDHVSTLIVHFLPYYCCYFVVITIELLYWHFVNSIKIRIISLNQNLENITCDGDNAFKYPKKKLKNTIDVVADNKPILKKTFLANQLEDLIMAYQKLIEATNIINDCHGLIILIVILGCFVHLLVTPYDLYCFILFNSSQGSSAKIIHITGQFVWCLCHFLRLLLIVEPCHGCLTESKNTMMTVCKLLCFHSKDEIKTTLEIFITNLSQCKIEFTVFGMTNIHRGILTATAGALTTYLVILFQFKDN